MSQLSFLLRNIAVFSALRAYALSRYWGLSSVIFLLLITQFVLNMVSPSRSRGDIRFLESEVDDSICVGTIWIQCVRLCRSYHGMSEYRRSSGGVVPSVCVPFYLHCTTADFAVQMFVYVDFRNRP